MTGVRALLTILLFLTVAVSGVRAGDETCSALFVTLDGRSFPTWRLATPFPEDHFSAASFLPADFLKKLDEAGLAPSVAVRIDSTTRRGQFILEVTDATGRKRRFGSFRFWAGETPDSVVVERLEIRDPFDTRELGDYRGLHPNQARNGLPIGVGIEFRKNVYAFLAAGGYRSIEVTSSQDYLVGVLYRRLLGGVQTEPARKFSAYLDGLFRYASKSFPKGLRMKNVDEFSSIVGDYGDPRIPFPIRRFFSGDKPMPITAVIEANLAETGIHVLKDESRKPVALVIEGELLFLYPEGYGYRPLRWKEIHERHPDWVRVDVPLPKPKGSEK